MLSYRMVSILVIKILIKWLNNRFILGMIPFSVIHPWWKAEGVHMIDFKMEIKCTFKNKSKFIEFCFVRFEFKILKQLIIRRLKIEEILNCPSGVQNLDSSIIIISKNRKMLFRSKHLVWRLGVNWNCCLDGAAWEKIGWWRSDQIIFDFGFIKLCTCINCSQKYFHRIINKI